MYIRKKCKQQKETCDWHEVYTLFVLYILIIKCLFFYQDGAIWNYSSLSHIFDLICSYTFVIIK